MIIAQYLLLHIIIDRLVVILRNILSSYGQFGFDATAPQWARASSFTRFLDHATTHHNRWDSSGRVISPSQRSLPDNTHKRQTSVPPVGFEPTISAGKRPQTYALERAATGTASCGWYWSVYFQLLCLPISKNDE